MLLRKGFKDRTVELKQKIKRERERERAIHEQKFAGIHECIKKIGNLKHKCIF